MSSRWPTLKPFCDGQTLIIQKLDFVFGCILTYVLWQYMLRHFCVSARTSSAVIFYRSGIVNSSNLTDN